MYVDVVAYSPDVVRRSDPERERFSWTSGRPDGGGELSRVDIAICAGSGPVEARLFRGLTSSYDLFYAFVGGRLVVSDRFSHVVGALPASQRDTSAEIAVDHLLHRALIGTDTYCAAVSRVGHGAEVVVDLRSGAVSSRQVERMAADVRPGSVEDYVARIDAALSAAADEIAARSDGAPTAMLFSGGVDSTLAATYHPEAALLHCSCDSPEFLQETRYAEEAAGHIGRACAETRLREEDFLAALEEAIDRCGRPPEHAGTIVTSRAMRSRHDRFLCGLYADTLFGFGSYYHLFLAPKLRAPWRRAIATAVAAAAPSGPAGRLREAVAITPRFDRRVGDPEGFAGLSGCGGVYAEVARIYGPDLVRSRVQRRLDYVAALGALPDPDSRDVMLHIEAAHLINYFCGDALAVWRQLAEGHGKSLACTFRDRRVFEAALSIPAAERFVAGRRLKPHLKRLLGRRAPSYPVHQTKLGGVLPVARFCASGPLSSVRERFAMDRVFQGVDLLGQAARRPGLAWNAVTFAGWRTRVAERSGTMVAPEPRAAWLGAPSQRQAAS
jgi:asparagine synthetase B (glutamine-hydrolysing)